MSAKTKCTSGNGSWIIMLTNIDTWATIYAHNRLHYTLYCSLQPFHSFLALLSKLFFVNKRNFPLFEFPLVQFSSCFDEGIHFEIQWKPIYFVNTKYFECDLGLIFYGIWKEIELKSCLYHRSCTAVWCYKDGTELKVDLIVARREFFCYRKRKFSMN